MDETELDLGSLKPLCRAVRIDGQRYILREPNEDAVASYRRMSIKGASLTEKTLTGLGSAAEGEPSLVAACLFKLVVEGDQVTGETPVTEKQIRSWVGRICAALFDQIKLMCPYIVGEPDTEDSLTKEIAKLQEKLTKLRADKDDSPKNSPYATSVT